MLDQYMAGDMMTCREKGGKVEAEEVVDIVELL